MALLRNLILLTLAFLSYSNLAVAEYGDKGYWFYKESKPLKPLPPKKKQEAPEPEVIMGEEEVDCEKEWSLECGFQEPKSFKEQEKMRDALMQDAYMNPSDASSVKQLQKYTKWIVDQSIQASKLWKYNMVQDSSLDPTVDEPISTYGLKLSMTINKSKKTMVWETLKDWGATIIMFSKDDCIFCHEQADAVRWLNINTGLDVHGASLFGDCPSFLKTCSSGALTEKAAQKLNVDAVPAFFIHLPDNVWIKVSNGLISAEELEDRIYSFFVAWRMAIKKGVEAQDGNTPMLFEDPKNIEEFKSLLIKE